MTEDTAVLPVVPEIGDWVDVEYHSRRAEKPLAARTGQVVRVAPYTNADDAMGYHFLIREDRTTYLIATVDTDGDGRKVFSVNYDEDGVDELQIAEFYAKPSRPSAWYISWANAEKTRRVTLGLLESIRIVAVGD